MSRGHLIAFEGLDQSGKQTQAERLARRASRARAQTCSSCRFPTTRRRSARRSARALHGERDYAADVMQLLYIANRYEYRRAIEQWLARRRRRRLRSLSRLERRVRRSAGARRRRGSTTMQRHLPQPSLTLLLDIPPEASLQRKQRARDRYERDLRAAGARARELSPSGGSSRDWHAHRRHRRTRMP